jgi:predicted small lipoprotein YifL
MKKIITIILSFFILSSCGVYGPLKLPNDNTDKKTEK